MKLLFATCSLFITVLGCSLAKRNTDNAMQIVEVTSLGQGFNSKAKILVDFTNETKIVFKNEYRLYITGTVKNQTQDSLSADSNTLFSNVVKKDTVYFAYVTCKGCQFGLEYSIENFRSEKGIVFNVDSVLTDELTFSFSTVRNYSKFFDYDWGTPVEVIKKGKTLIEKFAPPKKDHNSIDSIFRYYDKDLKDIDFTFSRRLDEQHKSKLCNTMMVANMLPKGILSEIDIPKRIYYHELKRSTYKNMDELNEIFEKFKKDKKELNLK